MWLTRRTRDADVPAENADTPSENPAMVESGTCVRLVGLGHAFPGQAALFTGLDATLRSGEVVAAVGPSGSGKSTLLGIIAGWTAPTEGKVERPQGIRTAWVFQNPHGVARRTALDHVVLPLLARGLSREQAELDARAIMTTFGLAAVADRDFAALSGGEGQRLMLGRALAGAPDLMLVDEPTAQLDPTSAASVIEVLAALAGRGCLVVIATHDPRVRDACTRTIDLAA
jgi:lipoprotein-releasing system ATP-binding protein